MYYKLYMYDSCAMLQVRFHKILLVTSHNTLKTLPVVQRDRHGIEFGFRLRQPAKGKNGLGHRVSSALGTPKKRFQSSGDMYLCIQHIIHYGVTISLL